MKKLAAAIFLTISLSAKATFVDGNRLHDWLTGRSDSQSVGMTYIAGVFDAMQGLGHCAPENVTLRQVSDMAKMSLAANPALRNQPADQLIVVMLSRYWPCKKTSGSL